MLTMRLFVFLKAMCHESLVFSAATARNQAGSHHLRGRRQTLSDSTRRRRRIYILKHSSEETTEWTKSISAN